MSSKPRLAVDMDEVIADAHTALAEWLRNRYGYPWTSQDIANHGLEELATPEHIAAMQRLLHEGTFFSTFRVMPGSQEALRDLSSRFEIFITTAAMEFPASCAAKIEWLDTHFPFIPRLNYVFCGDKSIIAADLLVDDNIRHFARFGGQGVLFSAAHNREAQWPVRVSDWQDAHRYLLAWRVPETTK